MKLTSYPLRTSSATAWRNFVAASRKMNPFQRHGGNANGSHLTRKGVLVLTYMILKIYNSEDNNNNDDNNAT